MFECNACGCTFRVPFDKPIIKGQHLGHPDDDSEDEFEKVCPSCISTDFKETYDEKTTASL